LPGLTSGILTVRLDRRDPRPNFGKVKAAGKSTPKTIDYKGC